MIKMERRRTLEIGLYLAAVTILSGIAAASSWLWLLVAAVATDGCRGDVCTPEGHHWATAFPMIALIAAVTISLISAVAVTVVKLPTAWVWIGIPLAIATYFLTPLLANWGHSAGIW
ncbi:hypothetical protein EJ571_00915 [Mycobacteroides franklinii]|uniref:Transmembrane protein n=2 Tax=Mycobacteroides franklinii TaxID=948102 RepID=A0A4R5PGU7_9MYCO|nr:hypothetical protein [Mycobacteroides franklinii]TDH25896.1 hypothetical protein EJ571_00915 [Mycobacteroides franklinii]